MATTLIDCCGDATGGLEFVTTVVGSVSVVASGRTGANAYQGDSGAGNAAACVRWNAICPAAAGRISAGIKFSANPTADVTLIQCNKGTNTDVILLTTGALKLGALTGSTILQPNTQYRITLSYVHTSPTVNVFKVWIDGQIEITQTNASVGTPVLSVLQLGWVAAPGASKTILIDDVVIDDDSSNTDPGDLHVAYVPPVANNTNAFDTSIGANPSNRWENVDDVPINTTTGWQHAAATDVRENYGLKTQANMGLTGATLVARQPWVYAKTIPTVIAPVTAGTEAAAASGNITLNAPASPAVGDIWLAVIHGSDQVDVSMDAAWGVVREANGGGTTSRLSVFWFRYAGSAPNLVVTHTAGATIVGGIAAFRGCVASGSPIHKVGTSALGTDGRAAAGGVVATGVTTTINGCMLVMCVGAADDNTWTLPSGFAAQFEDTSAGTQNVYQDTSGTPDCAVGAFTMIQAALGATGDITASQSAADPWAAVLLALAPVQTIPADMMSNGAEASITLTDVARVISGAVVDDASWPSNAAGIGLRSTGLANDTFLYDAGMLLEYIPAPTTAIKTVEGLARASVKTVQSLAVASMKTWQGLG